MNLVKKYTAGTDWSILMPMSSHINKLVIILSSSAIMMTSIVMLQRQLTKSMFFFTAQLQRIDDELDSIVVYEFDLR